MTIFGLIYLHFSLYPRRRKKMKKKRRIATSSGSYAFGWMVGGLCGLFCFCFWLFVPKSNGGWVVILHNGNDEDLHPKRQPFCSTKEKTKQKHTHVYSIFKCCVSKQVQEFFLKRNNNQGEKHLRKDRKTKKERTIDCVCACKKNLESNYIYILIY